MSATELERYRFFRTLPFSFLHLSCFFVFIVGFSWIALALCLALYVVRVFGITAGYHRYFSHRSFRTSRWFQFALALLGASCAQKGPLWWAAHHRHHHRYSDTDNDIHSPGLRGLWWSHIGWIVCDRYYKTNFDAVRDLARFPELRFIDRYHLLVPIGLATLLFGVGQLGATHYPQLGVTGMQLLVWGFCLSTVLVYHGTFAINSFSHLFGSKRFDTGDDSRNNWLLALLTLGEGWHNNHHRYPGSERQGFYWWEIDLTHYALTVLSWFRIVWDLRCPPQSVYLEAQQEVNS